MKEPAITDKYRVECADYGMAEWHSTYTTFNVLFSTPVAVFQKSIKNATQAKGGFDNIRSIFADCK